MFSASGYMELSESGEAAPLLRTSSVELWTRRGLDGKMQVRITEQLEASMWRIKTKQMVRRWKNLYPAVVCDGEP
ncbi:hypothetical protein KOW79_012787 [Hemibagrus wyckioides]|uniref:Uncharacterized protein n=1 Tax=Hemibagrus wyckioides TaxID=337641 RepID=A0A9D3NLD3_9TELE|nr:hypothetical protein KOW79_012787 [Hemibagrus wyckioides]